MKNEQYNEMYGKYKEGFSLSQVGKMYGMSRQSVYVGFKRRGFEMRSIKPLPFLSFDSKKFTLANTGYYRMTDGDRELMHRYVWMHHNGEIEKGFDIHHINRDRSDNRIENLELIGHSEHAIKYNLGINGHNKHKFK